MAEKLQITVVGLGLIGASAGLALRRFSDKVLVVGHDPVPAVAGQAKAMGAVDRTEWNLINAVAKADRILLALPTSEIRATLEAIAQDLKPGCVIVDTADAKVQVLRWADELLPANVYFVGGHPIIVADGPETSAAKADLFQNKMFCLVANGRASDNAIHLAADLVQALGAHPFFLDAVEHDGMAAMVEHLPLLMAGALMRLASHSPSWGDMRKLAGNQFYSGTWIASGDAKAAAGALAANREQAVRCLDELIAELSSWRESLAAGEEAKLAEEFEAGMSAAHAWLRAQSTGNWEEQTPAVDIPTSGSYLRQMIGFGGMNRAMGRQPAGKSKR